MDEMSSRKGKYMEELPFENEPMYATVMLLFKLLHVDILTTNTA